MNSLLRDTPTQMFLLTPQQPTTKLFMPAMFPIEDNLNPFSKDPPHAIQTSKVCDQLRNKTLPNRPEHSESTDELTVWVSQQGAPLSPSVSCPHSPTRPRPLSDSLRLTRQEITSPPRSTSAARMYRPVDLATAAIICHCSPRVSSGRRYRPVPRHILHQAIQIVPLKVPNRRRQDPSPI